MASIFTDQLNSEAPVNPYAVSKCHPVTRIQHEWADSRQAMAI